MTREDERKFFNAILQKIKNIHDSKNADYSTTQNSLSNFYLCEEMGIPAWKGCLVRMTDKISRLMTFAQTEKYEVRDEKFEDTAMDLAVYSILLIILYREYLSRFKNDDEDYNGMSDFESTIKARME